MLAIMERLIDQLRRAQGRRAFTRVLEGLSDRQLRDIGLERNTIGEAVAREFPVSTITPLGCGADACAPGLTVLQGCG